MVLTFVLHEYTKVHIEYEMLHYKRGFFIYSCEEILGSWNVFVICRAIFKEDDSDFNSVEKLLDVEPSNETKTAKNIKYFAAGCVGGLSISGQKVTHEALRRNLFRNCLSDLPGGYRNMN